MRALVLGACLVLAGAAPAAGAAESPPPTWAVAVLPDGSEFSLEVAADAASRARGYMFRESVGPREGMLFIFERDGLHNFWMKNCRVSLDIVWLDPAFRIVDMALGRPPCPEQGPCPSVGPRAPARYVLEFAAGTAQAHGLQRGDIVTIFFPDAP